MASNPFMQQRSRVAALSNASARAPVQRESSVSSLTRSQRDEVVDLFRDLDRQLRGLLSRGELQSFFDGYKLSPERQRDVWNCSVVHSCNPNYLDLLSFRVAVSLAEQPQDQPLDLSILGMDDDDDDARAGSAGALGPARRSLADLSAVEHRAADEYFTQLDREQAGFVRRERLEGMFKRSQLSAEEADVVWKAALDVSPSNHSLDRNAFRRAYALSKLARESGFPSVAAKLRPPPPPPRPSVVRVLPPDPPATKGANADPPAAHSRRPPALPPRQPPPLPPKPPMPAEGLLVQQLRASSEGNLPALAASPELPPPGEEASPAPEHEPEEVQEPQSESDSGPDTDVDESLIPPDVVEPPPARVEEDDEPAQYDYDEWSGEEMPAPPAPQDGGRERFEDSMSEQSVPVTPYRDERSDSLMSDAANLTEGRPCDEDEAKADEVPDEDANIVAPIDDEEHDERLDHAPPVLDPELPGEPSVLQIMVRNLQTTVGHLEERLRDQSDRRVHAEGMVQSLQSELDHVRRLQEQREQHWQQRERQWLQQEQHWRQQERNWRQQQPMPRAHTPASPSPRSPTPASPDSASGYAAVLQQSQALPVSSRRARRRASLANSQPSAVAVPKQAAAKAVQAEPTVAALPLNVRLFALYSFKASSPSQLSFKAGEEVMVLKNHTPYPDWCVAKFTNSDKRVKGHVPMNFLGEQMPSAVSFGADSDDEEEDEDAPPIPAFPDGRGSVASSSAAAPSSAQSTPSSLSVPPELQDVSVAIFNFAADQPGQLTLRVGDIVRPITARPGMPTAPGWTYVSMIKSRVNGLIPSAYVTPVIGVVRALHRYEPQEENQIKLYPNDRIYVVAVYDENWYDGAMPASGARGLFPRSYVTPYYFNT